MPTVKQIEKQVRMARELGREVTTADDAPPHHENRNLVQHCRGNPLQSRASDEPGRRTTGFSDVRYQG
jgi:hypothetical protein